MTNVTTIDDDPDVRAARQRVAECRRRGAEAAAARDRLRPAGGGPMPVSLAALRAEDAVLAADEATAAAERAADAAARAARDRIVAARRPGRDDLVRRLLDAADAGHRAAAALRDYDAATAAAISLAPPPPPIPALLAPVLEQARALRAAIDAGDRRDDAPAPVRRGRTRVRLLMNFHDRADNCVRLAGDVFDAEDADARDLVRRSVAVAV